MDRQKLPLYIGLAIIVLAVIYYSFKENFSAVSFGKVEEMDDPIRFHSRKPEQYSDLYYNGYIIPNIKDNMSAKNKFLKGLRDYDINSTLIYTNELKK